MTLGDIPTITQLAACARNTPVIRVRGSNSKLMHRLYLVFASPTLVSVTVIPKQLRIPRAKIPELQDLLNTINMETGKNCELGGFFLQKTELRMQASVVFPAKTRYEHDKVVENAFWATVADVDTSFKKYSNMISKLIESETFEETCLLPKLRNHTFPQLPEALNEAAHRVLEQADMKVLVVQSEHRERTLDFRSKRDNDFFGSLKLSVVSACFSIKIRVRDNVPITHIQKYCLDFLPQVQLAQINFNRNQRMFYVTSTLLYPCYDQTRWEDLLMKYLRNLYTTFQGARQGLVHIARGTPIDWQKISETIATAQLMESSLKATRVAKYRPDTFALESDYLKIIQASPSLQSVFPVLAVDADHWTVKYGYRENAGLMDWISKDECSSVNIAQQLAIALATCAEAGICFTRLPEVVYSLGRIYFMPDHLHESANLAFPMDTTLLKQEFKILAMQEIATLLSQDSVRAADALCTTAIDQAEFSAPVVDDGKQLGNGGFGAVYSNTFQGSDVAIKVLTRDNPNALSSFQRECKILSSLNHPAIIRFYGTTLVNDNAAAVMECCPKGSLLNYIRNNPPLGFGQKIQIAVELASAVAYLHAKRLCHYDLKPANVLLTDKLEPKLCDFGLSDSSSKSAKGFTLTYCPPEQLQHKQQGSYSDVWSFGMLLYFLFTEEQPFYHLKFEEREISKDLILTEVLQYSRTPPFPFMFEKDHVRITKIIKSCWLIDTTSRPRMKKLLKEFKELKRHL